MSGSQNGIGTVLGASTAIGAGAAILPVTGGSTLGLILPIVAIVCGVAILASLSITTLIEKMEKGN